MVEVNRKLRRKTTGSKTALFPGTERIGRFVFLQHWQAWGVVFVTCAGLLGAVSAQSLLNQPHQGSCRYVFWPFASASFRFYCAQERARKNTLEDLFAAIALVDALDQNHPLRGAINPRIERWSEQALKLAAEAFHEGKLDRAVEFARKIPVQTAAAKLVQDRIEQWQTIWAEGEGIFREADATLKAENWRRAFWIMVKLLKVNNRYWSDTQYAALNTRILQAQKDEQVIAEARKLMRRGGVDNLAKALGLIQDMPPKSIFQKSAKSTLNDISDRLLKVAEQSLKRNDLATALDAAQLIPREAKVWAEAQDFETLAYASASAWSGSISGIEDAIKEISKLKPKSPLYEQAQGLILKWQGQIASIRYAQQNPAPPPEETYTALLEPPALGSDNVSADIQEILQAEEPVDTVAAVLSEADNLSLQGDRESLQAAIDLADSILPGQAEYENAQARVAEWRVQLDRLQDNEQSQNNEEILTVPTEEPEEIDPESRLLEEAQQSANQGTPDALSVAINRAKQIPEDSLLHFQSQQLIEAWSERLLALARRQAPTDLAQAIAIAQQIPADSPVYEAAQIEIRDWQARQR